MLIRIGTDIIELEPALLVCGSTSGLAYPGAASETRGGSDDLRVVLVS